MEDSNIVEYIETIKYIDKILAETFWSINLLFLYIIYERLIGLNNKINIYIDSILIFAIHIKYFIIYILK